MNWKRTLWRGATAGSVVVLATATPASATPARAAAPKSDSGSAQALFEEGRTLMTAGNYAAACSRFAQSLHLDAAPGTLLNLAACHEQLGKTATAWAEFHDALTQARRMGNKGREQFASEHLALLDSRVSRLLLRPPPGASALGMDIEVDDVIVHWAAWDTPIPVDPGDHVVRATAPRSVPWQGTVHIGAAVEEHTVDVPMLVLEQGAEPLVTGFSTTSAVEVTHPRPHREDDRIVAYISGGLGLVGLGVGSYFGSRAFSKWDERNAHCPMDRCSEAGVEAGNEARSAAVLADIDFGLGLALISVGTFFFLRSFSAEGTPFAAQVGQAQAPRRSSLQVIPQAQKTGGGFQVRATF